MIKNIQGTQLGKAVGHRVVVKSFSSATIKAMKDDLKPNLELPEMRACSDVNLFKSKLNTFLFKKAYDIYFHHICVLFFILFYYYYYYFTLCMMCMPKLSQYVQ